MVLVRSLLYPLFFRFLSLFIAIAFGRKRHPPLLWCRSPDRLEKIPEVTDEDGNPICATGAATQKAHARARETRRERAAQQTAPTTSKPSATSDVVPQAKKADAKTIHEWSRRM